MPKITPVLKNFGGGKPKDQQVAQVKCKLKLSIPSQSYYLGGIAHVQARRVHNPRLKTRYYCS
jgi:hypothetical protein